MNENIISLPLISLLTLKSYELNNTISRLNILSNTVNTYISLSYSTDTILETVTDELSSSISIISSSLNNYVLTTNFRTYNLPDISDYLNNFLDINNYLTSTDISSQINTHNLTVTNNIITNTITVNSDIYINGNMYINRTSTTYILSNQPILQLPNNIHTPTQHFNNNIHKLFFVAGNISINSYIQKNFGYNNILSVENPSDGIFNLQMDTPHLYEHLYGINVSCGLNGYYGSYTINSSTHFSIFTYNNKGLLENCSFTFFTLP